MFAVTVKGRLRSFLCASLSVWCVLCCTCCPDEKIYETLAEKFGAVVVLLFGATNCNSVNWVVITSSATELYVDGTAAGTCKVCFAQSVPMTQVLMTLPGGWT